MKDYETFDLGNIKLLSGKILKSAKLSYKTYGTLNKNSDNVISGKRGPSCGLELLFGDDDKPFPNILIETIKYLLGSMALPDPKNPSFLLCVPV